MKTLQLNDKGSWVRELQKLLIKKGYAVKYDSVFDQAVETALKDFQKNCKLPVTGILDATTWQVFGWSSDISTKSLTNAHLANAAKIIGVEVATIQAVYEIESRGKGFLPDGRPKILFEGHVFWKELKKKGIDPQQHVKGNENILYPTWTKQHYLGGEGEYERLCNALSIDVNAALASASWGTFQIMGFNYKSCGFTGAEAYVDACYQSEGEHLKSFVLFIKAAGLALHLKSKNWAAFAKGYNGPAYKENKYDEKLEKAYHKYARNST